MEIRMALPSISFLKPDCAQRRLGPVGSKVAMPIVAAVLAMSARQVGQVLSQSFQSLSRLRADKEP